MLWVNIVGIVNRSWGGVHPTLERKSTDAKCRVAAHDLTNKISKHFINVWAEFGRGLVERSFAPLVGDTHAKIRCYLALWHQVGFVGNKHHGHILVILDANNLLTQFHELLQRAFVGDRVDENKALAILNVEFAHGRELLDASSVENFKRTWTMINFTNFAVRIFNCWVVRLQVDILNKLN